MYAKVAPLKRAVADHLFRRFTRDHAGEPDIEARFISKVQEKRRAAFTPLDIFVRAGDEITRDWLWRELALYDHKIAPATFTNWKDRGIIEMERTGKIKPLSAQALLIAAMIDPGSRFLPDGDIPPEETWYCRIQRQPGAASEVWPVGRLNELPASSVCWTPMYSACWERGWCLIGDEPNFLGCVRFAGIRMERGQVWYDVTERDIDLWDAQVAALYDPIPGNELAPVQNLCRPLFDRLAPSRLGERKDHHGR